MHHEQHGQTMITLSGGSHLWPSSPKTHL